MLGAEPVLRPITSLAFCRTLAGGRGSQGDSGIWPFQLRKIFILRRRHWSKILPLAPELLQPLPGSASPGLDLEESGPFLLQPLASGKA